MRYRWKIKTSDTFNAGTDADVFLSLSGTDATMREVVIGNNVIAAPSNMIRFEQARRDGVASGWWSMPPPRTRPRIPAPQWSCQYCPGACVSSASRRTQMHTATRRLLTVERK